LECTELQNLPIFFTAADTDKDYKQNNACRDKTICVFHADQIFKLGINCLYWRIKNKYTTYLSVLAAARNFSYCKIGDGKLIFFLSLQPLKGIVAEWSGRGLQNLVQRFDSARYLPTRSRFPDGFFYFWENHFDKLKYSNDIEKPEDDVFLLNEIRRSPCKRLGRC
jgi:hypothetical protein